MLRPPEKCPLKTRPRGGAARLAAAWQVLESAATVGVRAFRTPSQARANLRYRVVPLFRRGSVQLASSTAPIVADSVRIADLRRRVESAGLLSWSKSARTTCPPDLILEVARLGSFAQSPP